MRPEGDKPVRFPGKTDCHPKKGLKNWWEVEISPRRSRTEEKRKVRKEIENEKEDTTA